MRAYIEGNLSVEQEMFLPEDLWFANEKCDDNTIVSKDCMSLSGLTCESTVENKEFFCRWKGVVVTYITDDGVEIETEDLAVKEFIKLLQERKMPFVNASAYFDSDVNVKFTKLILTDNINKIELDISKVEEIEFVA